MNGPEPRAAARNTQTKAWVVPVLAAAVLLAGAGAWALRWRSVSPEGLRQRVEAMAKQLIRDRWDAMRNAVAQVATDDGARAFFAANPGLSPRIPDAEVFVARARRWRKLLQPLPEAIPALETRDLTYVERESGTEMGYRTSKGTRVFMRWNAEDRLVEMRVY